MFNFISLQLKCPHCGESLMDSEHRIDNLPSIHLDIEIGDRKGEIWLSSIYGSYNKEMTIDVKDGEVAKFYCRSHHDEIPSHELCDLCGAPLLDFNLENGGKVSICSRAGCKKHLIEFEDLSTALSHFYEHFDYRRDALKQRKTSLAPDLEVVDSDQEAKQIIETGTYLHSYCPYCRKSLNEKDMLKLKIEQENGESGYLILSPYLNVFSHKSTLALPAEVPAENIKCWHCNRSLEVKDEDCPKCKSDIIKVQVATFTKMIDFYICAKPGCTWHGLSDEDLNSIVLEDSEAW